MNPIKKHACANISLKNIKGEKWKDIARYEKQYMVSNYGRVKSLAREDTLYFPNKRIYVKRQIKERILKQKVFRRHNQIADDYRYECAVRLFNDFGERTWLVHRLVYGAFIKKLNYDKEQLFVTHKDNNGLNNTPSNLKCISRSASLKNAYAQNRHVSPFALMSKKELKRVARKGLPKRVKPIVQFSLAGRKIKRYNSIKEASLATGVPDSNIIQVAKKRMSKAGNYVWEYAP